MNCNSAKQFIMEILNGVSMLSVFFVLVVPKCSPLKHFAKLHCSLQCVTFWNWIATDFKSNPNQITGIQTESSSSYMKSSWFSHNLNQITIWICPSLTTWLLLNKSHCLVLDDHATVFIINLSCSFYVRILMENLDIVYVSLWDKMFEPMFCFLFLNFVVGDLLSQGINASCTDRKLRSPLHIATAAGNEQIGEHALSTYVCSSSL